MTYVQKLLLIGQQPNGICTKVAAYKLAAINKARTTICSLQHSIAYLMPNFTKVA